MLFLGLLVIDPDHLPLLFLFGLLLFALFEGDHLLFFDFLFPLLGLFCFLYDLFFPSFLEDLVLLEHLFHKLGVFLSLFLILLKLLLLLPFKLKPLKLILLLPDLKLLPHFLKLPLIPFLRQPQLLLLLKPFRLRLLSFLAVGLFHHRDPLELLFIHLLLFALDLFLLPFLDGLGLLFELLLLYFALLLEFALLGLFL